VEIKHEVYFIPGLHINIRTAGSNGWNLILRCGLLELPLIVKAQPVSMSAIDLAEKCLRSQWLMYGKPSYSR